MPLAAVAGISALGSIGSSLIGSHSASSAADKQMQAAQQAAQLQAQGSNNALNYQNGIYNQTQQNLNPYIGSGLAANSQLAYLLGLNPQSAPGGIVNPAQPLNLNQQPGTSGSGTTSPTASPAMPTSGIRSNVALPTSSLQSINNGISGTSAPGTSGLALSTPQAGAARGIQGINQTNPGSSVSPAGGGFGSLTQGYGQTFQAPTDITEQNDPGYQARLKLGTDAIQRSAAARGNVLTGGTAKALDTYGQDYASNEYGNVYNRALNTFGTNYGVWNNDQNNIYNRLLGLSNSGQQGANTLGALGQSSAGNVTSNLLGTGQQIGQDYGAGAAANASGIYNSGAAWQNGLNGIGGNLSQLLLLKQLGMGGGGGGGLGSLSSAQSNQAWGNPGIYQSPTLDYGIGS